MKHNLPAFLGALLLGTLAPTSVHAFSTTPQTNRTGAPGHTTCAFCHTGPAGGGSVSISFSGGNMYEVGQLYSMSVTVSDPTKVRYGFSMVARTGAGDTIDVGSWSLSGGGNGANVQVHGTGNTNVSHQNAPVSGPPSKTYEMNWTAPATATGDITFYVATVAGNGGSSSGDFVYTSTLTISETMVANNLPPELTVPAGALNATTGVGLPVTGISVADPDAADGVLTLTLTAQAGTLTLSDSVGGGLGAGDITGNGTASVTATGTLAELNATLGDAEGLVYQSEFGFVAEEVLQVNVNDNGNTGPGGAMSDQEPVTITVHPQPSLSDFAFVDGDFQFNLNGIAGQTYDLFYTDDLETWMPLEQVTLVESSLQVTDENPPPGFRFYRAEEATP